MREPLYVIELKEELKCNNFQFSSSNTQTFLVIKRIFLLNSPKTISTFEIFLSFMEIISQLSLSNLHVLPVYKLYQFSAFARGLLDTGVVPVPVCYPDVESTGTKKLHINTSVCKGIVR